MTVNKVYICEGELDALRLWQEGRPAVSVTNGAGQVEKLPALLKAQYPLITHLCIATDQDEPGEEAAERTKKVAEALGFTTFRWHWKEAKDVTEYSKTEEQPDPELVIMDGDHLDAALDANMFYVSLFSIHGRAAARAYAYSIAGEDPATAKAILKIVGREG